MTKKDYSIRDEVMKIINFKFPKAKLNYQSLPDGSETFIVIKLSPKKINEKLKHEIETFFEPEGEFQKALIEEGIMPDCFPRVVTLAILAGIVKIYC